MEHGIRCLYEQNRKEEPRKTPLVVFMNRIEKKNHEKHHHHKPHSKIGCSMDNVGLSMAVMLNQMEPVSMVVRHG